MSLCVPFLQPLTPQPGKKKTKLKVFSFTHKQEKVLSGDVAGRFTTNPKMAMFDMQDLIKYVPNPFPTSARLFVDREATGFQLPKALTRDYILLLDSTIDTSLIATCKLCGEGKGTDAPGNGIGTTGSETGATQNSSSGGGGGGGGGTVVEIPASQDILVSLLSKESLGGSAGSGSETLHDKTVSLFKNFMSPVGTNGPASSVTRLSSPGEDPAQYKLFTMVHRARERECQAIKASPSLQKDLLKDLRKTSEGTLMYQPLSIETEDEAEGQYMAVMSSQANSDYEDTGSEDEPFVAADREKVNG